MSNASLSIPLGGAATSAFLLLQGPGKGHPGDRHFLEVSTWGCCSPSNSLVSSIPRQGTGVREKGELQTGLELLITNLSPILLFITFCYILNRLNLQKISVLTHKIAIVQLAYWSPVCSLQTHFPYFPKALYLKCKSYY